MNFQTIRYMEWAKRAHEIAPCRYDLSPSSVEAAPAEMLGPFDGLKISGNNAYGHPGLRAALAARYDVPGDRVLCSMPGSSMANFAIAATLLKAGDTALVERPCYEPLWRIFEALGARVEFVDRRAEDRYALDLGTLARAFAAGARALLISNPMNPTGTLLDPEAIAEAGRIAARHGAHVVVDEVYLDAAFGHEARARPAAAGGRPGLITTSSLTKAYGLGGLRAGWAIAPPEVVERAYRIFDYLAVEQCYAGDELALRALERLPALRDRAERRHRENWPILREWARGRRDLDFLEPDGGFIAWVGLPAGLTSAVLEERLRALDAAVAPGHFFGVPERVRVGFGGPTAALREGLVRLGRAIDGGGDGARDR